jgi:hypothetical protein
MLASGINWTNVIVALIAGLPAIIAAVLAGLVHRQVATPSGTSIGKQVEGSHLTAIANNHLLAAAAGATKRGDTATLAQESTSPPEVPVDAPAPPTEQPQA